MEANIPYRVIAQNKKQGGTRPDVQQAASWQQTNVRAHPSFHPSFILCVHRLFLLFDQCCINVDD
jgi:hypothetical protein